MTNAQTYIDGATSAVTLAAGDIVTGAGTGILAKVSANNSTTAIGVVYSGANSGKPVSYVAKGKGKVYAAVATDGTAIEVGTPLVIGTGSTRGAGQVFVAAATNANPATICGKALTAIAVNTTTAQETLIDAVIDFE